MSTLFVVENFLIIDKQLTFIIDLFLFLFSIRKMCFTFYSSKKQKLNRFVFLFGLFNAQFSPCKLYALNSHHNKSLSFNKITNIVVPKSIHIGGCIFLAIWHHKKLFYLFYLLTLQNIQHQWIYFNFQHNKII